MNSGSTKGAYNYGGSTTIQLNPYYKSGSTTGEQYRGALLKWDLSSIPSIATISNVSINFYVTDPAASTTYNLYDLKRTWTEGTNNGAAGTGASWNFYGSGTGAWGTTGAQNTSSDRNNTNLWSAGITTGSGEAINCALNASGVAVVQGWVHNPQHQFRIYHSKLFRFDT